MSELDHPIWNALTSEHSAIAQTHGLAVRYPQTVSPLAALREPTPQAFADLLELVQTGETVALFTTEPVSAPANWQVVRARYIDQMVYRHAVPDIQPVPLRLQAEDVEDMLQLVAATEPGPFSSATITMGNYYGVRAGNGQLMAMAGQRLALTRWTEISAVCTHPDARGKGYARALMLYLIAEIFAAGKTPILHVKTENGAKILYEKIGFSVRRQIRYTVLKPL